MNKHFVCDKRNCFGNIDGYCEPLVEPCNKKKCPFFKTQKEVDEAEERSASFNLLNKYNPTEEAYKIAYRIYNAELFDVEECLIGFEEILGYLGEALA